MGDIKINESYEGNVGDGKRGIPRVIESYPQFHNKVKTPALQ